MEYKFVNPQNPFGFHEVEVEVSKIKPHPKNPRTIDARSKMQLQKSLQRFGLIDKPILNLYKGDETEYEYLCLAGHQRLTIEKESGVGVVVCMIPEIALTPDEEEELLIRHNKNTGKFDTDKLADFDPAKLIDFGFIVSELPKIDLGDETDKPILDPIYPITPRFSEKHGYIMIIYDNDIDKANLETMLNIERVKDYKTERISVGKVITFEQFKKAVDGRNS